MKKIKDNYLLIITIIILSLIMCFFGYKKQGFHEDEIFSYGSSNYKYDNVYQSYGYLDENMDILYNQIFKDSDIKKFITFLTNRESLYKDETLHNKFPIWKTNKDAKEYLSIQKEDIFNYLTVYINQSFDVHPPLYYIVFHFISTLFFNTFTKYIGFSINLIFYILNLIFISKIMKVLNKKELSIPSMILYGLSIGTISTINFQRMYMMSSFFTILYVYEIIKYINNDYRLDNKLILFFTILGGFLTHYYYPLYIIILFVLTSILLFKNNKLKEILNLFKIHVLSAITGIILFPASIYAIFFSYRGVLGVTESINHELSYINSLYYYLKQLINLYSLQIFGIILILIIIIKLIINVKNKINIKPNNYLILLFLSCIIYILVVSIIAPYLNEDYTSRYIMMIIPVLSILIVYFLSEIGINNKYILLLVTILSIYGLIYNKPIYLYEGYNESITLAKNNEDTPFILVVDNDFSHLNNLPELAIYKKHLILNYTRYNFTSYKEDEVIENSNKIILCIKNWLNKEEIINNFIENTSYNKYEEILTIENSVELTYYIASK